MTAERPDLAQTMALLKESSRGTIADRMGIEMTVLEPDRVEGTMPVQGNHQPYGLLHGGASCVLAESLASMGAALHGWPDRSAVGIEINATHHRSATTGSVRGVATPLHKGRTITTWAVSIYDDADRLICTSRVTCALREV